MSTPVIKIDRYLQAHRSNFGGVRRGGTKMIVLHTSTGSLSSMDNWFAQDHRPFGMPQSSAHFGVGLDGILHQYVREDLAAYHGGYVEKTVNPIVKAFWTKYRYSPNDFAIGIEHVDNMKPFTVRRTKQQLDQSIELCVYICKKYNIEPTTATIIGHKTFRPSKGCPGNLPVNTIISAVKTLV